MEKNGYQNGLTDSSKHGESKSEDQIANEWFDKLLQATYETGSSEKVVQFYNEGGDIYEKRISTIDYRGPYQTAKSAAACFPANREQLTVLDVAAGTGMVAMELVKLGFKNIDALDPSSGMLEKAKKTGLYGRCINDYVGSNRLDIENDTYDLITICGGLGAMMTGDYIAGFKELIRIMKPGGYIVITTKQDHFSFDDEPRTAVETEFEKLEEAGMWKFENKRKISYLTCLPGATALYRKTPKQ